MMRRKRRLLSCAAFHPDNPMVRCHLALLMSRRKLRIAEVARLTGLNRSTVTALCTDSATRVELPAVNKLCAVLGCGIADLFEYVPDDAERPA